MATLPPWSPFPPWSAPAVPAGAAVFAADAAVAACAGAAASAEPDVTTASTSPAPAVTAFLNALMVPALSPEDQRRGCRYRGEGDGHAAATGSGHAPLIPPAFPGRYGRGHRMAVADWGSARTHWGACAKPQVVPPLPGKCHTGLTRVSTHREAGLALALPLVAGHAWRTTQRYWPPAAARIHPKSRHLPGGHAGQLPVHFPCRPSTHFIAGTLTEADHHGTQTALCAIFALGWCRSGGGPRRMAGQRAPLRTLHGLPRHQTP